MYSSHWHNDGLLLARPTSRMNEPVRVPPPPLPERRCRAPGMVLYVWRRGAGAPRCRPCKPSFVHVICRKCKCTCAGLPREDHPGKVCRMCARMAHKPGCLAFPGTRFGACEGQNETRTQLTRVPANTARRARRSGPRRHEPRSDVNGRTTRSTKAEFAAVHSMLARQVGHTILSIQCKIGECSCNVAVTALQA